MFKMFNFIDIDIAIILLYHHCNKDNKHIHYPKSFLVPFVIPPSAFLQPFASSSHPSINTATTDQLSVHVSLLFLKFYEKS